MAKDSDLEHLLGSERESLIASVRASAGAMASRPARAAPSPALSVRTRGRLRQDGVNKRIKRNVPVDPSASEAEGDVTLDERLWRMLPEELMDIIVSRLPLAARCRFRCVCRKWKQVSSHAPQCTIMSRTGDSTAKLYCDSEKKWFSLPSNRHARAGWTWEVVDVDAGLVCYHGKKKRWSRLWVCNPLDPSMSRLITPSYTLQNLVYQREDPPPIKLVVDRANKTFKVLVLPDRYTGYSTAVYESTTSCWRGYHQNPTRSNEWSLWSDADFFVWENIFCAHNPKRTLRTWEKPISRQASWSRAFSMESGRWIDVQADLPSEFRFPKDHFLLSDGKELVLVLFSCRKRPRPYFSVWKFLDKVPSTPLQSFMGGNGISYLSSKWEKWEKVSLASQRATVDLAGHRLARACYGGAYIWFIFIADQIRKDGCRNRKCVRYSFPTKSWSVVPCPGGGDWGENFKVFNWEPSLDVDPSFPKKEESVGETPPST